MKNMKKETKEKKKHEKCNNEKKLDTLQKNKKKENSRIKRNHQQWRTMRKMMQHDEIWRKMVTMMKIVKRKTKKHRENLRKNKKTKNDETRKNEKIEKKIEETRRKIWRNIKKHEIWRKMVKMMKMMNNAWYQDDSVNCSCFRKRQIELKGCSIHVRARVRMSIVQLSCVCLWISWRKKNKQKGRQQQGRDCVSVQMSVSMLCTIWHMLKLNELKHTCSTADALKSCQLSSSVFLVRTTIIHIHVRTTSHTQKA